MRYPLLIDANPVTTRKGPTVYLPSGVWEIEHDGLGIDFVIVLDNSFPPVEYKYGSSFQGDCRVHVEIRDSAAHKTLSVYAKLCRST